MAILRVVPAALLPGVAQQDYRLHAPGCIDPGALAPPTTDQSAYVSGDRAFLRSWFGDGIVVALVGTTNGPLRRGVWNIVYLARAHPDRRAGHLVLPREAPLAGRPCLQLSAL